MNQAHSKPIPNQYILNILSTPPDVLKSADAARSYVGLSTIAFSLNQIVGTPEHIQETDFTAFFLHSDLPNNSRVLYLDGKCSGRIDRKFGSDDR